METALVSRHIFESLLALLMFLNRMIMWRIALTSHFVSGELEDCFADAHDHEQFIAQTLQELIVSWISAVKYDVLRFLNGYEYDSVTVEIQTDFT